MAGIVALMIIKEVFNFVKTRRNGTRAGTEPTLKEEIYRQGRVTDKMYDVHLGARALDKNGEPKWYNVTQIQTENHNQIVQTLKELVTVNKEVRDAVRANGEKR